MHDATICLGVVIHKACYAMYTGVTEQFCDLMIVLCLHHSISSCNFQFGSQSGMPGTTLHISQLQRLTMLPMHAAYLVDT